MILSLALKGGMLSAILLKPEMAAEAEDKDASFPKENRITLRRDFERVYKEGKLFQDEYFRIFVLRNAQGVPRLGLAVSKKLGGAAARNRIKRMLRESFRRNKDLLKGMDIVVQPKRKLVELENKEMQGRFLESLRQCNKKTS